MHLIHKWSKWEDIEKGDKMATKNIYDPIGEAKVIGIYVIQQKSCTVCGQKKLREVRS